jgi:hypothetical protein
LTTGPATVDNSGDLFGSFAGGAFESKNSATLHYDASLREVGLVDPGVRLVIDRWYED